jgi:hypothetical protein
MINLFKKQTLAFDVLTEPEYAHVSELLYGGGAGGGKSQLGCIWIATRAIRRWVVRRYPARLRKAKKIAIDRNRKTGEKQFGIKTGLYIEVWSRDEINK